MSNQTKRQAERLGAHTLKILGSGWTSRVWENLGWHVAWQNGAVCLHISPHSREYWAMVGDIDSGAGNAELTPHEAVMHSFDPKVAVEAAIEYAQEADLKRREIMLSCATVLLKLVDVINLEAPDEKHLAYQGCNLNRIIVEYAEYAGPIVVFSRDRGLLKKLHNHMENCIITSKMLVDGMEPKLVERTLRNFQKGRIDILFLSMLTFSEGISLTRASHVIILDELPGSIKARHAIHRAHRIGRSGKLFVRHLNRQS